MIVIRRSSLTGKFHSMHLDITQQQLIDYDEGKGLVQKMFPHLSKEQREFLKTGITPEEWLEIFGNEEQ